MRLLGGGPGSNRDFDRLRTQVPRAGSLPAATAGAARSTEASSATKACRSDGMRASLLLQHAGLEVQRLAVGGEPDLRILDGAVEPHVARGERADRVGDGFRDLEHGDVAGASECGLVLRPPEPGAAATVDVDLHRLRAAGGLADLALVRKAHVDPE